jgi:small subunit ribosomal protein S7
MAELKLFGKWDMKEIKIEDPGLQKYVNISQAMVPKTYGRHGGISFHKARMNIVERFVNKLMVPGHRGRKHKITSGRCTGNTATILKSVEKALEIVEKKSNQNPVQVFVKAIENSAPLEEIAAYRLGGIIARKSVIIAPQRRLDLALRHLTQGIYAGSFRKKKSLAQAIADELMLAASDDKTSFAVSERARLEREAEGAR